MCAVAFNQGCSCQKGSKALSFWSLARCTQTCVWGPDIFQRLTQPLIYTQTTTGWHPDTLAARTSNRFREEMKPQRQRALFKSHCFLLLTYIPIFFFNFLHPFIFLSILCFHIHTSSASPACWSLHLSSFFPAASLMPCQWTNTEVRGWIITTSPSRNCSNETYQAIVELNMHSAHSYK